MEAFLNAQTRFRALDEPILIDEVEKVSILLILAPAGHDEMV